MHQRWLMICKIMQRLGDRVIESLLSGGLFKRLVWSLSSAFDSAADY